MKTFLKDQFKVCSKQLVTKPFISDQFSKFQNLYFRLNLIPKNITYGHFLIKFPLINCSIAITVFHRYDNFFWVEKLHLKNGNNKNNSTFGATSRQIFDLFELEKVKLNKILNLDVLVPINRWQFLSEISTANHISCNSKIAQKLPPATETLRYAALDAIRSIKSLTKLMRLPIWIMSGTLLGWYRQCDIIGHTTDLDFASWGFLAHNDTKRIVIKTIEQIKSTLWFYLTFGYPDNGYEMAFLTPSQMKLDLFFAYKSGQDSWITTGYLPVSKLYFRYKYPKFTLCSTSLLGEKVLVPCHPLSVIKAEYGLNWKVPDKEWHFYNSAKNVGKLRRWPKNDNQFYWENS